MPGPIQGNMSISKYFEYVKHQEVLKAPICASIRVDQRQPDDQRDTRHQTTPYTGVYQHIPFTYAFFNTVCCSTRSMPLVDVVY
jgi:hypothetical protein